MPELPEVETIRLQLEPRLAGRHITSAGSHPSPKFTPASRAVGGEITAVNRRGKYLIFALDGGAVHDHPGSCHARELIVHLGMTGRLSVPAGGREGGCPSHPHLRAWWRLDDGRWLLFHDTRRFGRIYLVTAGCYESIATLSRLGPEPFSEQFTGDSLWRSVRSSSRHLKTQVLSQRPVAGVGNIYADEAFWLARINPAVRRLGRARAQNLANAIRSALASGLRHGGTTLRDYVTVDGGTGRNQHHLRCYGRAGKPCERCGTQLRRRVIDARGTTWCPTCQRH